MWSWYEQGPDAVRAVPPTWTHPTVRYSQSAEMARALIPLPDKRSRNFGERASLAVTHTTKRTVDPSCATPDTRSHPCPTTETGSFMAMRMDWTQGGRHQEKSQIGRLISRR